MQLIQYFSDGTIAFNWDMLPDGIKEHVDVRDRIFKELQDKMKVNELITTRALFELNRYAMNRIKAEIKSKCTAQKTH